MMKCDYVVITYVINKKTKVIIEINFDRSLFKIV